MRLTFRCFLLFLFIPFSSFAKNCFINRAAFDLGSGSFKVKVAKVDHCKEKIIEVIFEDSSKTGFKDAVVEIKGEKTISTEKLKAGAEVVNGFFQKAKALGAKEFYGVGTQVFRDIKNSDEFLKMLPKKIKIKIATQQEEAELGYLAAKLNIPNQKRPLVVWDVGGGSQQLVYRDEFNKTHSYLGTFASSRARDFVRSEKKLAADVLSPNPVGKDAPVYQEKIKEMAKTEISGDKNVARILKVIPQANVVGLGNLHSFCILRQVKETQAVKNDAYSLEEVIKTIKVQSTKDDKAIGGNYADTDVTNLILIAGFMEAFGMKEISVVSANLTDALLVFGLK